MKKKKIPLRKCIVCNEKKPKKELIRVVKNKDDVVDVDLTGKANGRGAYICPSLDCLDKVKKNKKLVKILKTDIPNMIYDQLDVIIKSRQE